MMMTANGHPWMTALEMQFTVLSTTRRLYALPDFKRSVTDNHVMKSMATSQPFSWTQEATSAAWAASASIPEDAAFERDLLPDGLSNAFFWFDWPIPIPMKRPWDSDQLDTGHICCLLITFNGNRWTVSCGRMSPSYGLPVMVEILGFPVGVSLRELSQPDTQTIDTERQEINPIRPRDLSLIRFVLGASAWLKQRIISSVDGHIERHRRKQIAREFDAASISDVKIIQLRRIDREHQGDDFNSESVEWSCRWIVSGHWRNQLYANGERKLIYILPFVKGPADKPLRMPARTVYQVSR